MRTEFSDSQLIDVCLMFVQVTSGGPRAGDWRQRRILSSGVRRLYMNVLDRNSL